MPIFEVLIYLLEAHLFVLLSVLIRFQDFLINK